MKNIIELKNISKSYETGDNIVQALKPLNLSFNSATFIAIMGASGSGKSTLLNVLGLLDKASTGKYFLGGVNVADLEDNDISEERCRKLGMIFQSFNLFSHFSVLENVCVPMQYADKKEDEMRERAIYLLEKLGLGDRMTHKPTQLSGGQSQRVAIARALANDPPVILADEPTGNLDDKTGCEVMDIFQSLVNDGRTVIMVTHNPEYEKQVQRIIKLHDGDVVFDGRIQ